MTLRSNIFAILPYIAQSLFLWPSAYRKGRHAVRTDRNAPQDRVTNVDCRMSTGLLQTPATHQPLAWPHFSHDNGIADTLTKPRHFRVRSAGGETTNAFCTGAKV